MTKIKFYTKVSEPELFSCRLAQQMRQRGHRLVICTADEAQAERLDQLLWTWSNTSFLPHCRADSDLAAQTPIIVDHRLDALPHHELLLNLGPELPKVFSRFDWLLEVVPSMEPAVTQARERFRFYRDRGYDLTVHDMSVANGEQQ